MVQISIYFSLRTWVELIMCVYLFMTIGHNRFTVNYTTIAGCLFECLHFIFYYNTTIKKLLRSHGVSHLITDWAQVCSISLCLTMRMMFVWSLSSVMLPMPFSVWIIRFWLVLDWSLCGCRPVFDPGLFWKLSCYFYVCLIELISLLYLLLLMTTGLLHVITYLCLALNKVSSNALCLCTWSSVYTISLRSLLTSLATWNFFCTRGIMYEQFLYECKIKSPTLNTAVHVLAYYCTLMSYMLGLFPIFELVCVLLASCTLTREADTVSVDFAVTFGWSSSHHRNLPVGGNLLDAVDLSFICLSNVEQSLVWDSDGFSCL